MATVEQQVLDSSNAIDQNISAITTDRGFLSQNLLQYFAIWSRAWSSMRTSQIGR